MKNEKDKMMIIKLAFHLAALSNHAKERDLCKEWSELLFFEFFA